MNLPTTFDNLIQEANRLDLYKKLIKQLNKDFLYANINLEFDENVLPSSLKLMLHETVFNLIQEKFADYLNLLYIIDVSENKVKKLDGIHAPILAWYFLSLAFGDSIEGWIRPKRDKLSIW